AARIHPQGAAWLSGAFLSCVSGLSVISFTLFLPSPDCVIPFPRRKSRGSLTLDGLHWSKVAHSHLKFPPSNHAPWRQLLGWSADCGRHIGMPPSITKVYGRPHFCR